MAKRPFIPWEQYNVDALKEQGNFSEEDINSWLNIVENLNEKDKAFVEHVLTTRNEAVVNFSPTASQCLCCNTAAYLLGGMEQAKSILFYLIKYITKDSTKLTLCVNLIREARKKLSKYPSRADDAGTPKRTGQYFLTILANKHTGLSEIADTQASLCLIEMPNQVGTAKTTYVFIKSAIAYVKEMLAKLQYGPAPKKSWTNEFYESHHLFDDPIIRLPEGCSTHERSDNDGEQDGDDDHVHDHDDDDGIENENDSDDSANVNGMETDRDSDEDDESLTSKQGNDHQLQ
jgi:hypothetical protein